MLPFGHFSGAVPQLGVEWTFAGRLVSTLLELEQTSGIVLPLHELEVEQISAAASLSVQGDPLLAE